MRRVEDWPARLAAFIDSRKRAPFRWGVHDCALFACDCIFAMTGVDPAAWFRAGYMTRTGAYGQLKRFGGGGLKETVEKITGELGMAEIEPKMAGRGDLAMVETTLGSALGIVLGKKIACASEIGISLMPLGRAIRAWRV